jgi:hypothetical protein
MSSEEILRELTQYGLQKDFIGCNRRCFGTHRLACKAKCKYIGKEKLSEARAAQSCPAGMTVYGDGSACKDNSVNSCALWGNVGKPRCKGYVLPLISSIATSARLDTKTVFGKDKRGDNVSLRPKSDTGQGRGQEVIKNDVILDDEQKESFFAKNKMAIIGLGAVAVIGAGIFFMRKK